MDTQLVSRRWGSDAAALAAGLVTALLVSELVGTVVFTRTFEQGPLAIAVAYPAALGAGLGVGLSVRQALRTPEWELSPPGAALVLGAAAFVAVGGAFGVYADVAASPFRDLVMSALLGLGAALVVAVGTYRHLTRGDPERASRTLLAAVTAVLTGLLSALGLFVLLTTLLDPYIWPAPIVTGPVALVSGLVLAVVAYGWVSRQGAGT